MARPWIGITVDSTTPRSDSGAQRPRYECALAYARQVERAQGIAVMLPYQVDATRRYARRCDAIMLTGGGDPDMSEFNQVTDSRARVVDPLRQDFELTLLDELDQLPDKPVLGICLGMQWMAIRCGGSLHQYLPDVLVSHAMHQGDTRHPVRVTDQKTVLLPSPRTDVDLSVVSAHRQAVAACGGMRPVAWSPDGVIEAIDDPDRRFYLGVQWHPERGGAGPLNQQLIHRFVRAARCASRE